MATDVAHKYRMHILELIQEGLVEPKAFAEGLLGWLSEDDCERHCREYGLLDDDWDDDDDDEEEEEDVIV